jgi:hypothetical protein
VAADVRAGVVLAAVLAAAGVAAAVVAAGEVRDAVSAVNGVHPASANTRRAIPLRVRRIHPA